MHNLESELPEQVKDRNNKEVSPRPSCATSCRQGNGASLPRRPFPVQVHPGQGRLVSLTGPLFQMISLGPSNCRAKSKRTDRPPIFRKKRAFSRCTTPFLLARAISLSDFLTCCKRSVWPESAVPGRHGASQRTNQLPSPAKLQSRPCANRINGLSTSGPSGS